MTIDYSFNTSSAMSDFTNFLEIVPKFDFKPSRIVFNGTTTICFFSDGTKVISKLMNGDEFDAEIGVMACIAKKIFGSRSQFMKFIVRNNYVQESKPTIKQLAKNFVNNTISYGSHRINRGQQKGL